MKTIPLGDEASVYLVTLGCKVNQYESQWIAEAFHRLGYRRADSPARAGIIVVNTCTVTAESDLKSRKMIRKLVRENPDAQMIVTGCAATGNPELFRAIEGVCHVVTGMEHWKSFLQQYGPAPLPEGIASFGTRHRAYVKVQDGCKVGCAYCIIPKVRPVLKSRPVPEVLREIQCLSRNGYREIVLTGIHLGHYGIDLPAEGRPHLATLLQRIVDLPDPFRVRISSLEAVEVRDELIELMVRYPDRICPHLHLSMQSGSDTVLRRMRRRWLSTPFVERCEEILARFDRLALTTDIIVGFPGETDENFEETCQVVQRLRFSKVHLFRFSPRSGTEAAGLPYQISGPTMKKRLETLSTLAARIRQEYAASLCGMTLPVLMETAQTGTSDRYFEVQLPHAIPSEQVGTILPVTIKRSCDDQLFAE